MAATLQEYAREAAFQEWEKRPRPLMKAIKHAVYVARAEHDGALGDFEIVLPRDRYNQLLDEHFEPPREPLTIITANGLTRVSPKD